MSEPPGVERAIREAVEEAVESRRQCVLCREGLSVPAWPSVLSHPVYGLIIFMFCDACVNGIARKGGRTVAASV